MALREVSFTPDRVFYLVANSFDLIYFVICIIIKIQSDDVSYKTSEDIKSVVVIHVPSLLKQN